METAQVPEETEYKVKFKLKEEVARELGIKDRLLTINFPSSHDALSFLRVAQSRKRVLRVNLPGNRLAELHPKAWTAVTFETPQQVIVTPSTFEIGSTIN